LRGKLTIIPLQTGYRRWEKKKDKKTKIRKKWRRIGKLMKKGKKDKVALKWVLKLVSFGHC